MDIDHIKSLINELAEEADKMPVQQVRSLIDSGKRRLHLLVKDKDEMEAMAMAIARLEEDLAKRQGGNDGSVHRNAN